MVEPITYFCTSGPVTSACFYEPITSHKTFLLAGTGNGSLFCWDLKSCSIVQNTNLFTNPVLWMGVLNDRLLLVQARFNKDVKICTMNQEHIWSEESKLSLKAGHVGFCPGDIHGNIFVLPTSENGFAVKEISDDDAISSVGHIKGSERDGMLTALKLSSIKSQGPIKQNFFAASPGWPCLSKKVQLGKFGHEMFQILLEFQFQIQDFVPLTLDFDEDKLIAVVAGSGDKIISLKLDDKLKTFTILSDRKIPTKGISNLCVRSHDKKILICGGWDSTIKLFSWLKPERLKPLGALKFHSASVNVVACTRRPAGGAKIKGHLIAAGSKDEKVSLWSIYSDD